MTSLLPTPNGEEPINFVFGFARVSVSFFFGVLLYRMYAGGAFRAVPAISPFVLAAVLIASFCPRDFALGWAYDLACILLLFPAIIIAGTVDNVPARWEPAMSWAGRLSYPVYVLHRPIIDHLSHVGRPGVAVQLAALAGTMALVVGFSAVVAVFYDEPVRKWLTRKVFGGSAPAPAAAPVLLADDGVAVAADR